MNSAIPVWKSTMLARATCPPEASHRPAATTSTSMMVVYPDCTPLVRLFHRMTRLYSSLTFWFSVVQRWMWCSSAPVAFTASMLFRVACVSPLMFTCAWTWVWLASIWRRVRNRLARK